MRSRWAVVAGPVALLAWGEWANWRWSRTLVGEPKGRREAVVVLGYRNPQPEANVINRWRVRAGLRSIDTGSTSYLLFSGGSTGAARSEAQLMASYAVDVLEFAGPLLLEDESRSTWENVTKVIPMLEEADRIKIVSQPAHALKARVYLLRQRPDLAARLTRAADYRPGEWLLVKPLLAAYGHWTLRRVSAAEKGAHRNDRAPVASSFSRDGARC